MLELKRVCFGVQNEKGSKEILKDVDLKLEDRQFIVITGPNGGGKSTLAKLIMGIEKPVSGQILFNGEDITDWDITRRAKAGISFAFQQPVRFKGITVKDLIRLASGDQALSTNGACRSLSAVGLCAADYVNREVDASLSGGELKRIEIATIIARQTTKLAVFDEPEAGIDLWSFHKLTRVFEKMHEEQRTILIISHQERILNIADEIVLIADGRIQKRGTRDAILPELMEVTGGCNFFKEDEA